MRKINFSQLFKNHWVHLLALGLFFVATFIYFQPQFSGHGLKQHDIEQFKGMSNEINHHRDTYGEEPLWTNSMFGGMPTYQISTHFKGNLLGKTAKIFGLWLKSPAGLFLTYLLGFYIMLLCMKVDPKVAIVGAFAFAFSSYFIIILQAGHETKAQAIGFAPPVIGAFYLAYRNSIKWGLILSALFMGMELWANHVQITYYLIIVLVFLGIGELIEQFKKQRLIHFLKVSAGLIIIYLFAAGINYGRLALTNDYSKYTIRGGNDITINVDGSSNHAIKTSGLDKDYITQWSYGVSESMTLISPNIKGASSSALQNSQFADLLRSPELRTKANLVAKNNVYWGDQPFTSGPVYLGIIVFFLAVLGMVYLKGPRKWMLLAATILTLMLSWGKNFMGLTDFFLEHVPLYNKFRAVTIILAMVELTIPILAVLFLDQLFKQREEIKQNIKPFYITTGGTLLFLILLTFSGLGDSYMSAQENEFIASYEEQIQEQLRNTSPQVLLDNGIDINNPTQVQQVIDQQMKKVDEQFDALVDVRKSIYQSSMWRSVLFFVLGAACVFIFLKFEVRKELILGGLLLFIVVDLAGVDIHYLHNKKSNNRTYDHWVEESKKDFPLSPTQADKEVLEQEIASNSELKTLIESVKVDNKGPRGKANPDELWSKKFQTLGAATNYRVYEPALGFNSSRASYFHKALNGYHGAKLRRIQNVKDFYLNYNDMNIYNMLNIKYFLQENMAMQNPGALGNSWLIKEVNVQNSPDKELLALGKQFIIENHSDKGLFINDEAVKEDTISGRENIVLFDKDSIPLDLSNTVRTGINASYVEDINGQRNWVPAKELEKDSLNSFTELVSVRLIHEFDPSQDVIVGKDVAQQLSSLEYSGDGTITMTSYAANELKYQIDVAENQFAVFSEMYYPDGWNAYIANEKVEIHRVNYLLRGIELPEGSYELVMKFEVPKYKTANTLALTGSLILLIVMGGFFVKDFLLKKEDKEEEE